MPPEIVYEAGRVAGKPSRPGIAPRLSANPLVSGVPVSRPRLHGRPQNYLAIERQPDNSTLLSDFQTHNFRKSDKAGSWAGKGAAGFISSAIYRCGSLQIEEIDARRIGRFQYAPVQAGRCVEGL